MKAITGTFYKGLKQAKKQAERLDKSWRGKARWFVVEFEKGYMVVSENQLRACGYEI